MPTFHEPKLTGVKPCEFLYGAGGVVSRRENRLAFVENTWASSNVGREAPKVNRKAS
jgi:hypothetical protein